MPQHLETPRSITAAPRRSAERAAWPGMLPATAITLISCVLCWAWLAAAGADQPTSGAAEPAELAQVDDADISAGLTTLDGSPGFLAGFQQKPDGCQRPLAWVTVVRAPGQPAGSVRIQSGNYFSPVFGLSETPVRIALPYPAPYEVGHGTLAVLVENAGAIITLHPAWHISASAGRVVHRVTWSTGNRCRATHG